MSSMNSLAADVFFHSRLDNRLTQHYRCVIMIPDFIDVGGPWQVLPPGVHDATLEEIEGRFATPARRRQLFLGLKNAVAALQHAGCREVLVDGSFVTAKPLPGDFDACWDPVGVDAAKLDPVFLDFSDGRKEQKRRFAGELFPSTARADGTHFFRDFFQIDKYTGNAKGIIRVHLSPKQRRKVVS